MNRYFKKHTRFLSWLLIVCCLMMVLSGCTNLSHTEMQCDVMKIGKADCIVLAEESYTVLIDCGESDDGTEIIKHLQEMGTDEIDCLIITHFDRDHIGGAADVIDAFPVKRLLEPDYEPESPDSEEYLAYRDAISRNQIQAESLNDDLQLNIGGMRMQIYTANAVYDKNIDNNNSLVVDLTHEGNRFLFTGDIEKQRIQDMLEQKQINSCDFLKVPHHGRYNSALNDLFEAASPAYAAITCSVKNPPEQETLDALEAVGCIVYSTKDSEVHVRSTKNGVHVDQSGT